MIDPEHPFHLEFYIEPGTGKAPVLEWMRDEFGAYQRRALGGERYSRSSSDMASRSALASTGRPSVTDSSEFRLRHNADEIIGKHTARTPKGEPDHGAILLRVFCHAYGDRIVLLLGGYDKAVNPGRRRQDKEIEIARKRLRAFRSL